MCPTSCYHTSFMATPELNGHRMYSYTLLDCNFGVTRVLKLQAMSEAIYPYTAISRKVVGKKRARDNPKR